MPLFLLCGLRKWIRANATTIPFYNLYTYALLNSLKDSYLCNTINE
ncbi:hypothetical protein KL86DYS2_10163 [uncultured Dysgonomonas sp.]|uniref:Uncharacterized protein n=1 Tax=uncultured Dysgonomonas sp. TaxID=206096 RepID=A0A212IWM4_9BACT|nr:hypothetical protein KL86DYS2_10163 [uncultured Dysgonomonas sp.]